MVLVLVLVPEANCNEKKKESSTECRSAFGWTLFALGGRQWGKKVVGHCAACRGNDSSRLNVELDALGRNGGVPIKIEIQSAGVSE